MNEPKTNRHENIAKLIGEASKYLKNGRRFHDAAFFEELHEVLLRVGHNLSDKSLSSFVNMIKIMRDITKKDEG